MKRATSIRDGLTAATCTLIGLAAPRVADATEVDTSLLFYTEFGNRLTVLESMTRGLQQLAGGKRLEADLTVDIMTGASPNGATPADQVQTFTRPSGRGSYTIRPGQTPLDDTFQDNRGAVGLTLEVPFGRRSTGRFGTAVSVEYDYVSFGANGTFTRSFDRDNTTVSAGVSGSLDYLDPEGDQPIPLAPMEPPGVPPHRVEKNENKAVLDGLFSVTQVIGPATIARLNYSINYAGGYLTDPFKVLSVVDTTPGPNEGEPLRYLYENRPGDRTKQSVYGLLRQHAFGDVVGVSYRYMWDDWDIRSHTAELRYHWQIDDIRALEPQVRFYHQTGARFYRHSLHDGAPLPDFASADYRLAEFNAVTAALRILIRTHRGHFVNVRLGYYLQMGDSSPPDAIGSQRRHDLFPTVSATIVQAGYGLTF